MVARGGRGREGGRQAAVCCVGRARGGGCIFASKHVRQVPLLGEHQHVLPLLSDLYCNSPCTAHCPALVLLRWHLYDLLANRSAWWAPGKTLELRRRLKPYWQVRGLVDSLRHHWAFDSILTGCTLFDCACSLLTACTAPLTGFTDFDWACSFHSCAHASQMSRSGSL